METLPLIEGNSYEEVILETCRDKKVSRPRVRSITHFSSDIRVEFPRYLREDFPIGTRFKATVLVCHKHDKISGNKNGSPYLRASNIGVIVESIPDAGIRAKIKPGTVSDRSYYYIWESVD